MSGVLRAYDIYLFTILNGGGIARTALSDIVFGYTTFLGNGWYAAPFIIGLILVYGRPHFGRVLATFVIVLALTGLGTDLLKHYFDAPRPLTFFAGKGYHVNTMFEKLYFHSMPSGHTCFAFSAATVYAYRYRHAFRAILAYIVAMVVGISRIYVGAHFPSDVLVGALFGTLASLALMGAADLSRISALRVSRSRDEAELP